MAPTVVVFAMLKVSARLLLHGAGVVCPAGQTFTFPKFCCEKLAVTLVAAVIAKLHVGLIPALAHAPPQPRNMVVPVGFAVRVTGVPLA
jgi:hypothetical protein